MFGVYFAPTIERIHRIEFDSTVRTANNDECAFFYFRISQVIIARNSKARIGMAMKYDGSDLEKETVCCSDFTKVPAISYTLCITSVCVCANKRSSSLE